MLIVQSTWGVYWCLLWNSLHFSMCLQGFPGDANGKEPACWCRRQKRLGFYPCGGKIPWRRKWQPTPVFFPGEFRRQRSLVGYSLSGHKRVRCSWAGMHIPYNLHLQGVKFNDFSEFHIHVTITSQFQNISETHERHLIPLRYCPLYLCILWVGRFPEEGNGNPI